MSKTIIIAGLLCLSTSFIMAQINCKTQLQSLKNDIKKDSTKLSSEINIFNDVKKKITVELLNDSIIKLLKEKQINISTLKKELNQRIVTFESLKHVCVQNNALNDDDVIALLKDINLNKYNEDNKEVPKTSEKQTYIYFNKDQIIKEDAISNKKIEGRILNDIIGQTNQESYLGDITIPKDGEEFFFYKNNKNNKNKNITSIKYKFKSIDIQINDGNFSDIRLKIEYKNQIYLFENFIAVSFLRYNSRAGENYLHYGNKQPFGIENDLKEMEGYQIRLSDILYYEYKIGNNYIPNNLVLELPKNDINDEPTNSSSPATYQIKEDTYLDKIIELRAYTDFLALFDEAENGLLQIEGSAKFYIFPFSRQIIFSTGQYEYLKSVTPYVNYARFENENRFAVATSGSFNQVLDVIEKRYLTMGLKLNLLEIYHKNYPIKANIFAVTDYNLTEAQNDMLDSENIKSLGYGLGINIASKRFNNFGFSYNLELKSFDLENFNTTNNIATDINFPIFKNQAEIFYHPTNNPNQAIFARLSTFNYRGGENNQAFYQFQFGYKFSLGSRTVTK